MSLKDIATLLDLCEAAPQRLGDADILAAYNRARIADIRLRVAGITALHGLPTIRKSLMRLGLGTTE
jgi:2-octaprenyl-6-methoxyphenol hydroxylase